LVSFFETKEGKTLAIVRIRFSLGDMVKKKNGGIHVGNKI